MIPTTNNDSTTHNPVGRFMVAVGAVISNPNGEILLLKRSLKLDWHPGEWEILYGRIAQFEDPRTGLIRETKEEVGLDIAIGQPLTVWHIYRGHEQTAHNELVGITFIAETTDINVQISDEHDEYRWVMPEVALQLVKEEGIKRDITAYVAHYSRRT